MSARRPPPPHLSQAQSPLTMRPRCSGSPRTAADDPEDSADDQQVTDVTAALRARWLVRMAADSTASDSDARSLALQAARLINGHNLVVMTRRALELARRGGSEQ
jgi:hypothetical protein